MLFLSFFTPNAADYNKQTQPTVINVLDRPPRIRCPTLFRSSVRGRVLRAIVDGNGKLEVLIMLGSIVYILKVVVLKMKRARPPWSPTVLLLSNQLTANRMKNKSFSHWQRTRDHCLQPDE